MRNFGVNDEYSGTVGRWIINRGRQPDFLSIYLPDTDGFSHRHDPNRSEESLKKADRQIGKVLGAFASWEEALEKNTIIIVGDHSQSLVRKDGAGMVHLKRALGGFSQAGFTGEDAGHKEIAVCVNERMSYIYVLRDRERILPALLERLQKVNGVDQVAWKDGDWYRILKPLGGCLFFRQGRDFWDRYGQGWSLQGDSVAADVRINGHNLAFGDYPDALAQIFNALNCENAGDIVVTAKTGYEFTGECGPRHPGCGSHGSLHRNDALVPLFVAGADFLTSGPRLLDLAPFVRACHGL